jgi:subtilisin family serine protease
MHRLILCGGLLLSLAVIPAGTQPADRMFSIPPDEMPTQFDRPAGETVLRQALALIRVPEARAQFGVTGAGLTAAVLDTGLRTTHVDFRGRIAAQRNWTADNDGKQDDATDGQGHGTNVAGIIAASALPPTAGAPRGEHTGVAPGARLAPLKVLANNGNGSFTWVESALQWVLEHERQLQISVVNMSLGDRRNFTSDASFANDRIRALIAQLRERRIPVVIAAGNDYFTHKQQGMSYPAILRESISVGAVYDANIGSVRYQSGAVAHSTAPDQVTAFSQRFHDSVGGSLRTDIFAPGASITSSGINNDRGASAQQGTSQAAPMTAGAILLLQEYHRRVRGELPTVNDLEKWLQEGAVATLDDCRDCDNVPRTKLTFPRIDALSALNAAKKAIEPSQR